MYKNDPKYDMRSDTSVELSLAVAKAAKNKIRPDEPIDIAEASARATAVKPGYPIQKLAFDSIPRHEIEAMAALRPAYYEAIDRGNPRKLKAVLDKGFPADFQNPATGETALHRLAGGGSRAAIRVLLAHGDCNFLLQDRQDRLASEVAYIHGRDPALARLLGIKERKQADAKGYKIVRRSGKTVIVKK